MESRAPFEGASGLPKVARRLLAEGRMRFLLVLCAAAALAAACGQLKSSTSCSDVILTPAGPRPKACVHEVPNGATETIAADGSSVVTLNGKVVATYPKCSCPDAPDVCTDRNGVTRASGRPWTDGCQTCSCGDLGGGSTGPVCTHDACLPDAGDAGDANDTDAGDARDADARDADASTDFFCLGDCEPRPSCQCARDEGTCSFGCSEIAPRAIVCGMGILPGNGPYVLCPPLGSFGCLEGPACGEASVAPVCIAGTWRCPEGATRQQDCQPDAGVDAGPGN
jgi:hypothetical protein